MEEKQGNNQDMQAADLGKTKRVARPSSGNGHTSEQGQAAESESTSEANQRADTAEDSVAEPSSKRLKSIPVVDEREARTQLADKGTRTPAIVTEPNAHAASSNQAHNNRDVSRKQYNDRTTPASELRRGSTPEDTGSMSPSSDLSSGSGSNNQRKFNPGSPVPFSGYAQEVPPAPPSTPASNTSAIQMDPGLATPLPFREGLRNAYKLEQQQMLSEGCATPAPKKPESSSGRVLQMSDDFSEWAVGDRYEMIRILGRGSYGEVAQAVDKYAGRPDAYVAIKRILSPFDQEVDAIRLYREIHILRRLKGHSCIINLLDVVQPPTDDLDDFHDLYLVFECMCSWQCQSQPGCVCLLKHYFDLSI